MSAIGIRVGDEAHRFANIRDEERVKRANKSSAFGVQEERNAQREARTVEYEFHLEEEGPQYGAGIAD